MKTSRAVVTIFAGMLLSAPVSARDAEVAGPAVAQGKPVPASVGLEIVTRLTRAPNGAKRAGPRSAYLLAYFKDETHSLYFATSRDGYRFTDVNGGEPVLSGRGIADQQGIRDPHIMRGPDNGFYMSMTDLHIFARREGLRQTEWERPREKYSWGNNRNLIFMKSYDLVHWTHAKANISQLFPAFAEAGCAWAPQTLYDAKAKKLMVYFTTRQGSGPNYMVYGYADAAFTTLKSEPRQILYYPNPKVNTIDADITKVGSTYRMFYVVHDKPNNIRQAISTRINQEYVPDPRKVDPESLSAEAPNLWRRHGTNTYVLMYDVFGAKPNNMGFAETRDFRTFTNIGRFNDPGSPMKATNFSGPKHGTVMPITVAEAERLEAHFGGVGK